MILNDSSTYVGPPGPPSNLPPAGYPLWMYNATLPPVLVENLAQQQALGSSWTTTYQGTYVAPPSAANLGSFANLSALNTQYPPKSVAFGATAYTIDKQQVVTNTGTLWTTVSKSLLAKIRAGMAAAANGNNSVELQPWLPPASVNTGPGNAVRANGQAYTVGATFTNAAGTHQFMVRLAGTSAGSEPATVTNPIVTSAPYNMGDITDGTATLAWMGPVRTATALANAPSVSSGAKPAQLSKVYNFGTGIGGTSANSWARFIGGTGAFSGLVSPAYIYVRGSSTSAGSRATNFAGNYLLQTSTCAVEFMTDAPFVALDINGFGAGGYNAGLCLNIEIDGRRLMDGATCNISAFSAGNGYILLDWRSSGGRKARRIRISPGNDPKAPITPGNFVQFHTSPQDSVWYPQNSNRWRLACVGDSIFSGSASWPFIAGMDRASIFAALIGCDDVVQLGVGGTGFTTGNPTQLTFIQRLADLVTTQPDVVYIGGAYNDTAGVTLIAAALAYYQAVRAALPSAMIVQAGTYGGNSPTTLQAIDASLLAAVTAFNDSNTYFIPASTDTPPWGTGTGSITSSNGSGNADIFIGPTDSIHPGMNCVIDYLPFKDAQSFRNLVNSL